MAYSKRAPLLLCGGVTSTVVSRAGGKPADKVDVELVFRGEGGSQQGCLSDLAMLCCCFF